MSGRRARGSAAGPLGCRAWRRRLVGRSGLRVSRLGLGTLTWGRDTDEHEAADQLKQFVDAGGTLVDTAASYGEGAAEELLGSLVGALVPRDGRRARTKAGMSRRAGVRRLDVSRRALLADLEGSLARLGTDHVDLWLVHAWSDEAPLEETLSALQHAVVHRARPVRRLLELLRLADGARGDAARAGRRARRRDRGGVLAGAAGRRARGGARGPGARAWACWRGPRSGAAR